MSKQFIAEAHNLHLLFNSNILKQWAARDHFVQFCKNPAQYFTETRQKIHVINDLSFSIQAGDRIGLLGRNGAGKTSLCRCLTKVYRPSSGHLEIRGDVRGIFDTSIGVYPDLSGRENVEILVEFLYPAEKKNHLQIVNEIIEFSGLGQAIDRPFKYYSNGMQTRLCLSLVTSKPSSLLILDEVFEGADQYFREKMSARMIELAQKSEAVVFVSHSFEHIRKFCNRIWVLEDGRFLFDGSVEDGLQLYKSLPDVNYGK